MPSTNSSSLPNPLAKSSAAQHPNPCKRGPKCEICKYDKGDGKTLHFRICPFCCYYSIHSGKKPAIYCANKKCSEPFNQKAGRGRDIVFVDGDGVEEGREGSPMKEHGKRKK